MRQTYKEDWYERHLSRERAAFRGRAHLTKWCKTHGIEIIHESIRRHIGGKRWRSNRRFLFCHDGEVISWEPFDAKLVFESSGEAKKVHYIRTLKGVLLSKYQIWRKRI